MSEEIRFFNIVQKSRTGRDADALIVCLVDAAIFRGVFPECSLLRQINYSDIAAGILGTTYRR